MNDTLLLHYIVYNQIGILMGIILKAEIQIYLMQ